MMSARGPQQAGGAAQTQHPGVTAAGLCTHSQLPSCPARATVHPTPASHLFLPAGDLALKMSEQRYLWSVLPCLMAWPTVAMPVGQAAGIQVRWVVGQQPCALAENLQRGRGVSAVSHHVSQCCSSAGA